MRETANFLAADLGASNGRVLLGRWDGERFELEVLHRFENGPTNVLGRLYWDVLALWREVKVGMARYAATAGRTAWSIAFLLRFPKRSFSASPGSNS